MSKKTLSHVVWECKYHVVLVSPDAWVYKWPFGKGLGWRPNYFFRKVRGRPFLAYFVC